MFTKLSLLGATVVYFKYSLCYSLVLFNWNDYNEYANCASFQHWKIRDGKLYSHAGKHVAEMNLRTA
jgi:hypothetical protein